MAGTGSYFQTYLKRALANLEAADRERTGQPPASPAPEAASTCACWPELLLVRPRISTDPFACTQSHGPPRAPLGPRAPSPALRRARASHSVPAGLPRRRSRAPSCRSCTRCLALPGRTATPRRRNERALVQNGGRGAGRSRPLSRPSLVLYHLVLPFCPRLHARACKSLSTRTRRSRGSRGGSDCEVRCN